MSLLTNIWLDEDIRPINTPKGVEIKLRGSYHNEINMCLIWVGVFINGTELRIYRYHNTISQEQLYGDSKLRLFDLNQNKIDGFLTKYVGCSWRVLSERLIQWSQNPTYREIIKNVSARQ